MKQFKTLCVILILLPFFSYGQTSKDLSINNLLDYINTEVGKYNKYGAKFNVEGKFLVFINKFGEARIPFKKIGFRMDEKTYSIDVYCLDSEKCIHMYNEDGERTPWLYYNVSMPYNDGMAESGYTVFEKFKQLKNIVLDEIVVEAEESLELLRYINSQFLKYNKYGSNFDVHSGTNKLIFTNKFGIAKIAFSDIDFRINEKTKSIDVYCLDGSKCIEKYDDKGSLTTWDYYNVSLPDGDGMANEIYTVLEKCRALKTHFSEKIDYVDNEPIYEDDIIYDSDESIDDLLSYINSEIKKYNKYGSRLSIDGENLVFMNQFGKADIPFRAIDFRINYKHNSIDIYCLDESKCIEKYDDDGSLTTWDYYNISLPDGDGMASTTETVIRKCKILKRKALR